MPQILVICACQSVVQEMGEIQLFIKPRRAGRVWWSFSIQSNGDDDYDDEYDDDDD